MTLKNSGFLIFVILSLCHQKAFFVAGRDSFRQDWNPIVLEINYISNSLLNWEKLDKIWKFVNSYREVTNKQIMPKFDIHDIAATPKNYEENETTLDYFTSIAFQNTASEEITSLLKQNRDGWQSIWVRRGKKADTFDYPADVLKLAKNNKENIISLVITGTSKSVIFMYELKDHADNFSITSANSLPDGMVIFILFFVNK
ncbi:MAG: hypothetical protein J0I32_05690 [Sphingobacteriales bacterium]|nr:hypothetical protein [Sphingobacteriales bacterium]